MAEVLERRSASAEREAGEFRSQAQQAATRITVWVLVANAAAALFCLNGIVDHKICDWESFRPLVVTFLWGVGFAFASHLVGMFVADTIAETLRTSAHFSLLGLVSKERLAANEARISTARARIQEIKTEVEKNGETDLARSLLATGLEEVKTIERECEVLGKQITAVETHGEEANATFIATRWMQLASGALVALAIWCLVSGINSAMFNARYVQALCGYEAPAAPSPAPLG